jgi:hypothetical protein
MCRGSLSLPYPVAISGKLGKSVVALPLAILLLATPATPQIVAGRVVDAGSGEPVDGVTITLVDTADAAHRTVVSNPVGEFMIVIPAPGTYILRASRLGYATTQTRPIEIGEDEAVEVELRLDVEAVELEPLTVVVRRRETVLERDLREYYDRIERYGRPQLGSIRIRAREDLEPWDAFRLTDVQDFYAPRWRSFGRGCAPLVFLDGLPMWGIARYEFLKDILVSDIEGIEFYQGVGPVETRYWDPRACGVVLVWTRPDRERRRLGYKDLLGAAAAVGFVVLLASLLGS